MTHSLRRRGERALNDGLRMVLEGGFRSLRSELARCFPADSDGSILDLGCGTGLMRDMLPAHRPVVGVDLNPASIGLAETRRQLPEDRWIAASATSLPLPDASCDEGLSHALLHHLDDEQARLALAEMARVCRGRCIIADLDRDHAPFHRQVLYALDEGEWIRHRAHTRALIEEVFVVEEERSFRSGVNHKTLWVTRHR